MLYPTGFCHLINAGRTGLCRSLLLLILILSSGLLFSQLPINAYAKVTAISGTSLSLSNVNEIYHSFEDGDYVIIIQMQDNVIGTNTTNASTFGDLGAIGSAGLYEVARISSHTESTLIPTSVALSSPLVNTYNIGTNSSVQLVTYRSLGLNFTTIAGIGTLPWNGNIGGVTAMSTTSVLTLLHSVTANGCGFAGGVKNTPNGYSNCDNTTYTSTLTTRYAGKGEGIYKNTNTAFAAARGKILNGGGGGNDVNAGGGGGGNYSAGGGGGSGWTPAGTGCSPIAGGIGGLSLSTSISSARVFMGGGGGGGHENDGVGTVGGNGGGIIFIKAGTLLTTTCSGISISASGSPASTAQNDGAGGGGAGGSVVFQVGTFSIAPTCSLNIQSSGGSGGNSNAGSSGAHGGGGGGGQGVIVYSGSQPTANVTTSTNVGAGGVSCSGCGASVNGSVGSGTANAGIIPGTSGPLPVELASFTARLTDANEVLLNWNTAVEINCEAYWIERMREAENIEVITHVPARGSYNAYRYTDTKPLQGMSYYRLRVMDKDGSFSVKNWAEVNVENTRREIVVYPNPSSPGEILNLKCSGMIPSNDEVEVLSVEGQNILQRTLGVTEIRGTYHLDLSELKSGIYLLKIRFPDQLRYAKLVIAGK